MRQQFCAALFCTEYIQQPQVEYIQQAPVTHAFPVTENIQLQSQGVKCIQQPHIQQAPVVHPAQATCAAPFTCGAPTTYTSDPILVGHQPHHR